MLIWWQQLSLVVYLKLQWFQLNPYHFIIWSWFHALFNGGFWVDLMLISIICAIIRTIFRTTTFVLSLAYVDLSGLDCRIRLEYNLGILPCISKSLPCQHLLNIILCVLFINDELLYPFSLFHLKMGNLLKFHTFNPYH